MNTMRADWDQRAKENAQHFIATERNSWEDRDFFRSGEINVANEVLPDMPGICGGHRSPLDLSVLEIGCGVGRMTAMLSRVFGKVTAVDVSPEMVTRARENLKGFSNVSIVLGDGATLAGLANSSQDFAFSFIVFQHIPDIGVIRSYCGEVFRVLRPGSLFKFQVNGSFLVQGAVADTWVGVSLSEQDAKDLCEATGFIYERSHGAGTQYFWLWFRKPGVDSSVSSPTLADPPRLSTSTG